MNVITIIILLYATLAFGSAQLHAQNNGPLPRRAFMGAMLTPLSDSLRQANGFPADEGVLVSGAVPGSSVESSGIGAGDIFLNIGGERVGTYQQVIAKVQGRNVGEKLPVTIFRNGKRVNMTLTLKPYPMEQYPGVKVEYDYVESPSAVLRSIITRPEKASGPVPMIYIIQGFDCSSIDQPLAKEGAYARMVTYFSGLGYGTYRVEKSGVGDSRGAPCSEVDFQTDASGFRAGLLQLRKYNFVDTSRVYIMGLSMGGVWGPMLAAELPVRGLIIYGAIAKPFPEYILDNWRRQWELEGKEADVIEKELRDEYALMYHFYVEKQTPDEIIRKYPRLAYRMRAYSTDPDTTSVTHTIGRHYTFLQGLYDVNISEQWMNVDADVLVMWGRGDYVASEEDNRLIVDIVNRYHPGNATYREIGTDHWLNKMQSMQESYKARQKGIPGEFNMEALTVVGEWLQSHGTGTEG